MMKKIIIFVFVALGIHLLMVFTGYDYIYTVLKMTVFKGKLSPAIDEYTAFYNDTVHYDPETATPWAFGNDYNARGLSEFYLDKHEELQTVAYLVIKDDSIRHEFYREGFATDSRSNSFSMAKSIVGALTGIALDEGYLKSLDQPVCDFLPNYCKGDAATMTIKHLLTMSPGINFDESYINPFAYPAKANYGTDLAALIEKYEVTETPGITFSYQSGTSQVLGLLLEKATGKSLSQYAEEKLWKPMGAEYSALWSRDREGGNVKAFCCFNSNARDFARFGRLYLHNGRFKGNPILDSAYVARSITPADHLAETNGEPNERYGYHWWIQRNYKDQFDFFYMRGLKGQYVIVIPDRKMIIVRLGRKREKRGKYELPADVDYWIDGALEVTMPEQS